MVNNGVLKNQEKGNLMNTGNRSARDTAGFTLIELMVVTAVIATIASIAIPNLLGARVIANETTAAATLRTLSSAQAQFQASVRIDTDEDGVGEFGYFGELSGATGVRDRTGGVTGPAITTPILSATFRTVRNGVVNRGGYLFGLFLPDAVGVGVPEAASGGSDPGNLPGRDHAETTWCCYAWPTTKGVTGTRVFFMNESGDVVQSNNLGANQSYSGVGAAPEPDAAFVSPAMDDSILGTVAVGTTGADGGRWIRIR